MAAEKLHRPVAKAVESRFGWLVHAMAPATKKYKKCSGGISGIIKATAKVTKMFRCTPDGANPRLLPTRLSRVETHLS